MRVTRSTTLAAASLLVALVPAPAAAQRNAGFQWRGTVLQGNAIEIRGVNGGVKAEPSSGGEVEVSAVRTGRRSDPKDVQIEVIQHGEGVTICAVYPSPDERANECRPGGGRMNVRDNDVQVTFTVRVPAGVRFLGRTVNGDIEASSLVGPVSLTTVNGDVTLTTSSHGDAKTVNGSIEAALGSSAWDGELTFETVNGSITLSLPPDTSADVHATTVNGEITSDFQVAVSGRINRRTLNGTIGSGGRKLDMQTVNGSVQLRRR